MKTVLVELALVIKLLVALGGCNGDEIHQPTNTPPQNQPSQPVLELVVAPTFNGTPVTGSKAGKNLLMHNLTTAQASLAKTNFMKTLFKSAMTGSTVLLNVDLFEGIDPIMPYIGSYGGTALKTYLAVKIPAVYYANMPDQIREIISQSDINQLDFFFIIQKGSSLATSNSGNEEHWLLNTHLWVDPTIPGNYFTAGALGQRFNKMYKMAVFTEDKSLCSLDLNSQLKSFSVHVHDRLFSPNTAKLLIKRTQSYAFFSLVLNDDTDKRAVVTLHWIVNNPALPEIMAYTEENNKSYKKDLQEFMPAVDINKNLSDTALVKYLKNTLR